MPEEQRPNILVIWGDDIGISNLSCYSDGLMGYRTPNIDRLADEGMRFTDSYGEQSCTAGRSAFITGQSVYRTGLSKVGLPGADQGMQAEDPTIAELLKPLGYATGQFGKNHLGDKDEHLPTSHGFDEFFGNLYHLNAEEEPEHPDYPPCRPVPQVPGAIRAARVPALPGEPTDGRQVIEDTGPLTKKRMETIDDEIIDGALDFIERQHAKRDAVLPVGQHHPYALPDASQARERGAGGTLAVALPRHHDRPRQARRQSCSTSSTSWASPRTPSSSTRPTTAPHMNSWPDAGHDAVSQREEHQLGRCLPRALCDPLARQDPRGRRLQRDHQPSRLAADVPGRGRRAGHQARSCWTGTRPARRRSRCISTGTTCCRT